MVSISHESEEQTTARLRGVIATAEFVVLPGTWTFAESPAGAPPSFTADTLAIVRDEDSWSALRPVSEEDAGGERFGLFSFHFPDGADNSGFVGWLAQTLKAELGTGVFVVCGSNAGRGGIYDYWGCPESLFEDAVRVVEALRSS